jgi:hypothetical protein
MGAASQSLACRQHRRSRGIASGRGREAAALALLALVLLVGEPLICVLHCQLDQMAALAEMSDHAAHDHTGAHTSAAEPAPEPPHMPGRAAQEPLYEHLGVPVGFVLLALVAALRPLPPAAGRMAPLPPPQRFFRPPIRFAA